MWLIGLYGGKPAGILEIQYGIIGIRPLSGFVAVPGKLTTSQVGVVTWIALLILLGLLSVFHRFMEHSTRPGQVSRADKQVRSADGGHVPSTDGRQISIPAWFQTDTRWIVTYVPASGSVVGLAVVGALSILAIACATLFAAEFAVLVRTQYIGVYATGMFVSLAAMTAAFYAWFMPHVEVAEHRGHETEGDSS